MDKNDKPNNLNEPIIASKLNDSNETIISGKLDDSSEQIIPGALNDSNEQVIPGTLDDSIVASKPEKPGSSKNQYNPTKSAKQNTPYKLIKAEKADSDEKSEKVRNKIIILYILSRLPGITVAQLTSLSLDTCYMNYFSFATAFEDLCDNKLVTKSHRKNEQCLDANNKPVVRCDNTAGGIEILNKLRHVIPENIHMFLTESAKNWEKISKRATETISKYDPDLFGGYTVTLKLSDGIKDTVLLQLSVPSKELAAKICENWKLQTQDKYMSILKMLTD